MSFWDDDIGCFFPSALRSFLSFPLSFPSFTLSSFPFFPSFLLFLSPLPLAPRIGLACCSVIFLISCCCSGSFCVHVCWVVLFFLSFFFFCGAWHLLRGVFSPLLLLLLLLLLLRFVFVACACVCIALCLLFVCCITCCLKWSFRSFEAAVNCIVTDTAVQQINQRQWEVMRRLWCGEQRVLGV